MRQVKGEIFLDYVRMVRSHKQIAWNRLLTPEDLRYVQERIDPQRWYPMATFERMGNAILAHVAKHDLIQVRMWGRYQVDQLWATHETLVAPWDPVETLCRFRVLRGTFFDFEAIRLPLLHDDEAHILVSYYMGMPAEEAAAFTRRWASSSGCWSCPGRRRSRPASSAAPGRAIARRGSRCNG